MDSCPFSQPLAKEQNYFATSSYRKQKTSPITKNRTIFHSPQEVYDKKKYENQIFSQQTINIDCLNFKEYVSNQMLKTDYRKKRNSMDLIDSDQYKQADNKMRLASIFQQTQTPKVPYQLVNQINNKFVKSTQQIKGVSRDTYRKFVQRQDLLNQQVDKLHTNTHKIVQREQQQLNLKEQGKLVQELLIRKDLQKKRKTYSMQAIPAMNGLSYQTFYEKIGGDEALSKLIKMHLQKILVFNEFRQLYDLQGFEIRFKTFLEFMSGKPVFYNVEALREIHQGMPIKSKQFNLFKNLLLESFIQVNRGDPQLIFEFASFIEQYRFIILQKNRTFALVYNQRAEHYDINPERVPEGVYLLATQMYYKIFRDSTLSAYFRGILLKDQAAKFGRILNQMMSWSNQMDQTMILLRDSHVKFRLNNIHYVVFKQHLVNTFREIGLKDKYIQIITQRMDGYRLCIINQDSFVEIINNHPEGKAYFIRRYQKLIYQDKKLQSIINRSHKNFVQNHCHFLFYYFAFQNKPLLTLKDIQYFHKKCRITEEEIAAFEDNFLLLARGLGLSQINLQDFKDIWMQINTAIFNEKSIAKQIGSNEILEVSFFRKLKIDQSIQYRIAQKLQENTIYNFYFQNVDYQIKYHIKRIIAFLFQNLQFYKSNDLKVIHQNLRITDSAFELFLYIIKSELEEIGIRFDLIKKIEKICLYYKDCICSQKESSQMASIFIHQFQEQKKGVKILTLQNI